MDEEKLCEKDLAFIEVSLPYILDRERKGVITGKIVHNSKKVLSCVLREKEKILLKISEEKLEN